MLDEHGRNRDNAFLRSFSQLLKPFCAEGAAERLALAIERAELRALEGNPLNPILMRALRDTHQSEQRCTAVLALMSERMQ